MIQLSFWEKYAPLSSYPQSNEKIDISLCALGSVLRISKDTFFRHKKNESTLKCTYNKSLPLITPNVNHNVPNIWNFWSITLKRGRTTKTIDIPILIKRETKSS